MYSVSWVVATQNNQSSNTIYRDTNSARTHVHLHVLDASIHFSMSRVVLKNCNAPQILRKTPRAVPGQKFDMRYDLKITNATEANTIEVGVG